MLVILILGSRLYSQDNGYPKLILLDKDSLILIEINQLRFINNMKVNFDMCIEQKENLSSSIDQCKEIISLEEQKTVKNNSIIKIRESQLKDYEKIVDLIHDKCDEEKKKIKKQRNILGISSVALLLIALL